MKVLKYHALAIRKPRRTIAIPDPNESRIQYHFICEISFTDAIRAAQIFFMIRMTIKK